jgi:hypothetical protein
MNQTFNATAGFHLANAGTDRNVVIAEQICALETDRIRLQNEPEIVRLQAVRGGFIREYQLLLLLLSNVKAGITNVAWPVWHIAMTVIFVSCAFSLSRLSFEPFDFNEEVTWLCCIGLAFYAAYATSQFLEKTDLTVVVRCLAIVLFVASIAGLATLASVRGDIFLHQIQMLGASSDAASSDSGLAFYVITGPKMRLFLILLSVGLELAAGLAVHEARLALKARRLHSSPERHRLEVVEREIGQTEAKITFLRTEPQLFAAEFMRNLSIGLLDGATRHAKGSSKWPAMLAMLALLGVGGTLRGQPIDLWEGLDLSATSQATGYDGAVAHSENIEAAARIIASLPPGSRVTVAGISDQSFSRPFILFTGKLPTDAGKLREHDQILAARNRFAAAIRRMGGTIEPRFQATDILGFLILAGMGFHDTPKMRHTVLLLSDMRQSASPIDIEHVGRVPVNSALAQIADHQLFADLQGAQVFVLGAHAVGKDLQYWQSLRDFWAAYFARCHATLSVFSTMRETPDLNERK